MTIKVMKINRAHFAHQNGTTVPPCCRWHPCILCTVQVRDRCMLHERYMRDARLHDVAYRFGRARCMYRTVNNMHDARCTAHEW